MIHTTLHIHTHRYISFYIRSPTFILTPKLPPFTLIFILGCLYLTPSPNATIIALINVILFNTTKKGKHAGTKRTREVNVEGWISNKKLKQTSSTSGAYEGPSTTNTLTSNSFSQTGLLSKNSYLSGLRCFCSNKWNYITWLS